ncbi:MAG: PEP-CTERM sorting domain-containing protein [Phycisphaerae bacterium]|nr:PEP-CTERM sorting domain-containing protein [Phycisphaerae bacterium]
MMRKSLEILVAAVVLFVSTSPVMAVLTLADGAIHNIDYYLNDDVEVDYRAPGLKTELNIIAGANIYGYVVGCEDSIINIRGGHMDKASARDNSRVTVSGGVLHDFEAHDNSQVTISGGSIRWGFHANESSQITISDGAISSDFRASDNSQVIVSGGFFRGELLLYDTALLTIEGSDFAVDGTDVGYIELTSINGFGYRYEPSRLLTGTLLNGDVLDSYFRIGNSAKIVLVPEPTTLLLLGLGGLALRRRRTK